MHLHMMRYFLVTDILLMGGAAAAAGANRGTMGLGCTFWSGPLLAPPFQVLTCDRPTSPLASSPTCFVRCTLY